MFTELGLVFKDGKAAITRCQYQRLLEIISSHEFGYYFDENNPLVQNLEFENFMDHFHLKFMTYSEFKVDRAMITESEMETFVKIVSNKLIGENCHFKALHLLAQLEDNGYLDSTLIVDVALAYYLHKHYKKSTPFFER